MPTANTPAMDLAANFAAVAPRYLDRFGRLPIPPQHPEATINDLIFARMIEPDWPPLVRTLVDKSTAKETALRLCPGVRVPATVATIDMDSLHSPTELAAVLAPFVGCTVVAKPSQASGGTLFLRNGMDERALHELYDLATSDYAMIMREMQYSGLPRRVIVEELVPTGDAATPDDFKFHCIDGAPLLCQIDHARFGERWSRVYRVPEFEVLNPDDGLTMPSSVRFPGLDRLARMTEIAATLSQGFDYVRVDLYNGLDDVYFGEMTFTPAASLGIAPSAQGCQFVTETHRRYSATLMRAYHRGRA